MRNTDGVPRRLSVRPDLRRSDDRDRGAPICAADLTEPISPPSSNVDVQTAVVVALQSVLMFFTKNLRKTSMMRIELIGNVGFF
jgi:hypothetical protein